ncbi:MAG: hypothetical protein K8H86_13245 [Ignavibacteriaceae bacterium]|nr:hypothetical protein [Ignavibacteriaceae bacterium]
MKKIKILVAEDTKEARDLIIEGLQSYVGKKFGDENYFEIDRAESFQKGWQKLAESEKLKSFYDVFFADIDFTEDNKGGERDSGYKLIEKAFEVCPVTKIYTYSGQFHAKDLWQKYEELQQNGLIIQGMDKSHGKGGEEAWLNENLDKIVEKLSEEEYLLSLWQNHQLVLDALGKDNFFNSISGIQKFHEIQSNLESIIVLLKSKKNINADVIVFRIILQLYHRSLELFVTRDKEENKIVEESSEVEETVFSFISDITDEDKRKFDSNKSFLRKIAAFSPTKFFRFGYILNRNRNGVVHRNFKPKLVHILFANLTLATYVNGKNGICSENFQGIPDLKKEKGFIDFQELIEYCK